MNQALSDKIRIGGLCCAIIVVMRHSLNLEAFFGTANPHNWVAYVELFISKMTEMAVPYFFIISGYFFFKKSYYNLYSYKEMILKKARTLLIPYICWVIIGHIIMVPVGLAVFPTTIKEIGLAFWNAECAGVLWYVRSLILMMLLYPIYGWIFQINNKYLYLFVISVALCLWIPVDMRPLSTEGILFFLLGGIIQKYHLLKNYYISKDFLIVLSVLWIICTYYSNSFEVWPNRLNTMIGILVIWFSLNWLKGYPYHILLRFSGLSFLLYVIHIYLLKLLKFSIAYLYNENQIVALLSFILLPLIVTCIVICIGIWFNKFFPRLFGIITGGRFYIPQ